MSKVALLFSRTRPSFYSADCCCLEPDTRLSYCNTSCGLASVGAGVMVCLSWCSRHASLRCLVHFALSVCAIPSSGPPSWLKLLDNTVYKNSAQISQHSAAEWRIRSLEANAPWQLWVHWLLETSDQYFCVLLSALQPVQFISRYVVVWHCVAQCGSLWIRWAFLWWRLREYIETGFILICEACCVGTYNNPLPPCPKTS